MNLRQTYDYLMRARRDLWSALRAQPEELLSCRILDGEGFHCIKDFVSHIPAVEDGWINEDILRRPSVWERTPVLSGGNYDSGFAEVPLEDLLEYWLAVEKDTLGYLDSISEVEIERVVSLHDSPGEKYTVDGILSHVFFHEVRHTAQICVLLRSQGMKPPSLDLFFYLPCASDGGKQADISR